MIRTLLVFLSIVLFLLLSLPLLLFEWLLGKADPRLRDAQCRLIVQKVFRLILWLSGTKIIAEGKEHIPAGEAVLFVGNHRSYFDILGSYIQMDGKTGFVAKKEMDKIPVLRQWMRMIGCLFLDRDNIKEGLKTILEAIERVKKGSSVFIFPEGTRNESESVYELMEFHEGSLKIADKANCPVIPVAFYGFAEIFEAHIPRIKPATVVIRFGEAVNVKELPEAYKRKPGLYLKDRITAMLHEIGEDYPEIKG